MVETAKVDIRKLQQLNDRINQCLDALNQVRLSVHGLSHTTGAFGAQQAGQLGGFAGGQDPRLIAQGINPLASPLAQGGAGGFAPQFAGIGGGMGQGYGGLSHTSPFAQPFAAPWNPMLAQQAAQQAAIAPFAQLGGLSHTGVDAFEGFGKPTWADPVLQAKLAQTFPYAQYAVPPIVSLY